MQTKELTQDIKHRLDLIDWDSLKAQCGITREEIENNPFIASQLVYGQYTDLIPGEGGNLNGYFSLKAIPQEEGKPWIVKIHTMERPKTSDDKLYLYGKEITSEKVKTGLLEKTDWYTRSGERKFGYANANGGSPISIEIDGKKEQFLVSIHLPTNKVVGIKVDHVRNFFFDGNGDIRHRKFYGVELLPEQCEAFCEGKACRVDGCISGKFDKPFACYAQFDAAQRQLVECHPTWIKEALKAGDNLGLGIPRKNEPEKPVQPAVVVIQNAKVLSVQKIKDASKAYIFNDEPVTARETEILVGLIENEIANTKADISERRRADKNDPMIAEQKKTVKELNTLLCKFKKFDYTL